MARDRDELWSPLAEGMPPSDDRVRAWHRRVLRRAEACLDDAATALGSLPESLETRDTIYYVRAATLRVAALLKAALAAARDDKPSEACRLRRRP